MEQIEIRANDAGQRLDKFLLKTFPKLTKSMMYKGIRNKKIKVNRKRCLYNQILQPGDIILLFLPPDCLERKQREIPNGNGRLHILYEDSNLLIIHKPAGMLSQSDEKHGDCVVSRMRKYLYDKNEYDVHEHSFAPAICQRLDRNTEGLLIGCKNAETLRMINRAIAERRIHKYYQAKVCGHITKEGFYQAYIKKEGTKALVSPVEKPGFKEAAMHVCCLKKENDFSICEIELLTGRFHQIRALMSYFGHPLEGDHKYGYQGNKRNYSLVAYKLDLSDIDLDLPERVFEIAGL